ncbi:MAG: hypothetical protein JST01_27125 [Cyanobacteria bacterium SZAS TMP-1]|nr:hypothetical protein [Cyanobacteria bacterium SZAS TMP-1]
MEYALGFAVTASLTFFAIWVNDRFNVGGELSDEELGVKELTPVTAGHREPLH